MKAMLIEVTGVCFMHDDTMTDCIGHFSFAHLRCYKVSDWLIVILNEKEVFARGRMIGGD